MDILFEELDYGHTPLGELILRRRKVPMLENQIVYEVILNNEFLMSSLFHVAEEALAHLGLAELDGKAAPDVVVGGLGLGYTAAAVLDHAGLQSLQVIEYLQPVIEWHRRGLVPLGNRLTSDPRCHLVQGDFFALATDPDTGFDPAAPDRCYHAILLDIDHTPGHWLHPSNASFYSPAGLQALRRRLHPGGVFAMWADNPPEPEFMKLLETVFTNVRGEIVEFPNPIKGGTSSNTVYTCKRGS